MRGCAWIAAICVSATGCYTGVASDVSAETDTGIQSGGDGGQDESGSGDGGDESGGEQAEVDPGRVTLHRLNRVEYNNTIRDLFYGLDVSPADEFPADDHSFGFDNIADALNSTPLLIELYERAADQVLEAAFAAPGGETERFEAEEIGSTAGVEFGEFWKLTTNGSVDFPVEAGQDGDYTIVVGAAAEGTTPAPNMLVLVDGLEQASFDITSTAKQASAHEIAVTLATGAHTISVEFTNDTYDPDAGIDTNLLVDYVELQAPGGELGGVVDQLVLCAEGEINCTEQTVQRFAQRAWRRPLTPEEVAGLVEFVDFSLTQGDTWHQGLQLAFKATLLSPNFVFRVEIDPEPESLEPHLLGDYELASRLSYFLWSSMPDDALFEAAANGLNDPEVIATQVQRMLADDKAGALAENFAGQWLYTRAVNEELIKDPQTYPDFNTTLRADMRTEMEMLIASVIEEGRGLDELLTAKETFVNDRLAAFYGLPPVGTDSFVRVSLEGTPRKGLLTSGGLMAVLAHPNVTSPIKRGKWVVEQLLCIEPPPPPPDAEATVDPSFEEGPMRERLAKHREDPSCASCHELMDPVGLAFENYDGIGAWREMEGPYDIDPSGTLPIGGDFADALQMVDLIARSDQFAECATEKALLYGLGRGIETYDREVIESAAEAFANSGFRFEDLLVSLTTSDTFRMRRGEPNDE